MASINAPDGYYWLSGYGKISPAIKVFCMTCSSAPCNGRETNGLGAPAALVYRKVVKGGGCGQHGVCADSPSGAQKTPFNDQTSAIGVHKLSDDHINKLRSSDVANNLVAAPFIFNPNKLLGKSYHKKDCTFTSTSLPSKDGPCAYSTSSHTSTSYESKSTHPGISRWYGSGASTFGYIFPNTHVGYKSSGWGMSSHGGSTPNYYCTIYDGRACSQDVWFDWWVL